MVDDDNAFGDELPEELAPSAGLGGVGVCFAHSRPADYVDFGCFPCAASQQECYGEEGGSE